MHPTVTPQIDLVRSGILDTLPGHIALLDSAGCIFAVNRAWRHFALANLPLVADFAMGQNYLDVCKSAAGADSAEAHQAAFGIRRILDGDTDEFTLEYPCHSTNERRWFQMMVAPLSADGMRGAIVVHSNITENKQASRLLHDSERRFFSAFEEAPVCIALVALDGNLIQVNRAFCDLLGYTKDELTVLSLADIACRECADPGWALLEAVADGKAIPPETQMRLVHRRGSEMTVVLNVSLVRDNNDLPSYFIIQITDVSERNQARLALDLAIWRLSEAQRIGRIGDWTFDLASHGVTWSAEVFDLFGLDPRTRPASFDAVFAPVSRELIAKKFALAALSGESQQAELMAPGPNGEHVWMQMVVVPKNRIDGVVSTLYGTLQDITARKQNEMVTERMAAIVASSEDAIISKNTDGIITGWNKSAERIFGYLAAEVIGHDAAHLIPEPYRDENESIVQRIIAGERIGHFETVREAKDGTLIDVSVTFSPLKDVFGQVVGISTVLRDISEHRRNRTRLSTQTARLQHLSRRLMATEEEDRRRLGRELHDQTGSNLMAMGLNLEILRGKMPPEITPIIAPLLRNIELVLHQTMMHIRDVLSDLRPPALTELGLLSALRNYIQRMAAKGNVDIRVTGHEPVPRLAPDVEIALFRVVQEALTNALKHAQASHVTTSINPEGDNLLLDIEDDGKGFDVGAQLHAVNSLGMTTMQERCEAVGATLTLRSTPGAGTHIRVVLPRQAIESSENCAVERYR